MPNSLVTICAWCGRRSSPEEPSFSESPSSPMDDGTPVTHGICPICVRGFDMDPILDLHALTVEEYDRLPFGFIELDRAGLVRSYNAWEENLVGRTRDWTIGRHFFRDVAPCAAVKEFEGTFRAMVDRGKSGWARLDFEFPFESGTRKVRITLAYRPDLDSRLIIVEERSDR